jgi:cytochrome c6
MNMKKACILFLVAFFISVSMAGFAKGDEATGTGEALFKQNCSPCHPDGGNIINPQKTLHKKDREVNNLRKPEDIVSKMRNPGPGMTKFDNKTISDKDARAIANYILKTFN